MRACLSIPGTRKVRTARCLSLTIFSRRLITKPAASADGVVMPVAARHAAPVGLAAKAGREARAVQALGRAATRALAPDVAGRAAQAGKGRAGAQALRAASLQVAASLIL